MAEQSNSGLLSPGTGLDPIRNRLKQVYEDQGVFGAIAHGGGGLLDLLQLGGTMAVNKMLPVLYGEAEAERRRLDLPYAENSALAREITAEVAKSQGRLPPVRTQDVLVRPGPAPTGGVGSSVEQRVAADRAERAELARRGQVVTPPAEIDRTGGMTGAEAYMKEAARLREAEKQQEAAALKQKMDRDNATGTPNIMPYVLAGDNQAQNARERSFLERMAQSGLLSTLQGMARAERMYGVGPLAAFSESALDVQAARSAAEQKQREMGLELAKERIKAGDGSDAIRKMLAKGETQKLLSTAGNTFKMINASEKIRKILGTKGASGLANAAKSWATQFGNIFGFNLEATSRQEVEDIIGTLEQQIAGARIFGRDLSRFDYEVLAKVLKSPGILESDERIRNQYKRLINDLEQTHAQSVKSLNILIGRDTTRQLLRQANTTGNLFTKVE